jgi:hypothetical protein
MCNYEGCTVLFQAILHHKLEFCVFSFDIFEDLDSNPLQLCGLSFSELFLVEIDVFTLDAIVSNINRDCRE